MGSTYFYKSKLLVQHPMNSKLVLFKVLYWRETGPPKTSKGKGHNLCTMKEVDPAV